MAKNNLRSVRNNSPNRATLRGMPLRSLSLFLCLTLLAGCRTEILHHLTEQEVGKILHELRMRSIEAYSAESGKDAHTIKVSSDNYAEAAHLASQIRPLLRVRSPEEKPPGFLSGPEQEQLYVANQLARQLEDSLRLLPEVIAARVTIAISPSTASRGADKRTVETGSASVLIIGATGALISSDSIAQFIANGTAIPRERVHVITAGLITSGKGPTPSLSLHHASSTDSKATTSSERLAPSEPVSIPDPRAFEPGQPSKGIDSGKVLSALSTWLPTTYPQAPLVAVPIIGTILTLMTVYFFIRRARTQSLKVAYQRLSERNTSVFER